MRKDVIDRLSYAQGHLGGVIRMAKGDAQAADVIQQLAAVRSAIDRAAGLVLEDYAQECIDAPSAEGELRNAEGLMRAVRTYIVA